MKRLAAIAAICLLTSGCAHAPPTAEIPVAVPCPAPPATVRPHLPIADLRSTDSPDNVVKAYAASVETLIGYAKELETILSGYRR